MTDPLVHDHEHGHSEMAPLLLAFASGLAALIYEILWMRELRLLFGNTNLAVSTTLTAFFLGLAIGSHLWGKYVRNFVNPLRVYAALELGIAASALIYFFLLHISNLCYGFLFVNFASTPNVFVLVKFALSLLILFPPAFFMGGTLPVLGHYLVRRANELGHKGTRLYAVNTAGAGCGVILAAFFFPRWFGFHATYMITVAISLGVAFFAWRLSVSIKATALLPDQPPQPCEFFTQELPVPARAQILAVAFFSGFCILALEVLWTRMFEQVLQNSVYTFAIILFVFLLSLAMGSAVASRLARRQMDTRSTLGLVFLCSGIAVSLTPSFFIIVTNGLQYMPAVHGWSSFVLELFGKTVAILMLPVILAGIVFPYLFKAAETTRTPTSMILGNLASINTLGGAVGSLAVGYFLLGLLGLWKSILLISLVYLVMAIAMPVKRPEHRRRIRAVAALWALLALAYYNVYDMPVVALNSSRQETLLRKWEGNAGTVAVIQRGSNRVIKVNNVYGIGDIEGRVFERRQSEIPLLLHPDARSVFLLGLGTGITGDATLSFPVEKVVACELIPEVVTASREYFGPYSSRLYKDPRVRIIVEDGRNYLKAVPGNYDLIISELFVPFNAGVGTLYSREHFLTSKLRLAPDGLFVQWIPAYMFSRNEFSIIAHTMMEVFPNVTLWRGNFISGHPTLALVGHLNALPLDRTRLVESMKQFSGDQTLTDEFALARILCFYAGNLTAMKTAFKDYPDNTDDKPVIEYLSPVSLGEREARKAESLTSFALVTFLDEIFKSVPPDDDPYLSQLFSRDIGYVHAGLNFFKTCVYTQAGKVAESRKSYRECLSQYPPGLTPVQ